MDVSKYKNSQISALLIITEVPGCGLSKDHVLTHRLMVTFPISPLFSMPSTGYGRAMVCSNAQPIHFILSLKNQRLDKLLSFKALPPVL